MLQSASAATGLTPLARIVSTSHRDHRVFPDFPRPRARISRRRAASSPMFIIVFVFMGLSPFDRPIRHPHGANNSCAFHARGRALRRPRPRSCFPRSRRARVSPVPLARHQRVRRVSAACQSKAGKNTHTDQCTVGAGPLARSARTARRRRPPAEVRKKREYSRTCSRRRPSRSKGDREMVPDPDRPKGLPRGAPSHIHGAPSH